MTEDRIREEVRVALAQERYAAHPDQLGTAAREQVDRVTARVMDAIRPLPAAPAVDREGLANFVANAISRSSQQHVPVGYRVADALIAAGQVGGTDAQQRVDAALAVLADRHEDWCPGKIHANCCGLDCECGYGEIRDALIARKHPMPDRPFGAVHWPASSYTEVVAQRNEANARIDAALALLDPSAVHHIAGPLADQLRRVLTGQEVPDVPQ